MMLWNTSSFYHFKFFYEKAITNNRSVYNFIIHTSIILLYSLLLFLVSVSRLEMSLPQSLASKNE